MLQLSLAILRREGIDTDVRVYTEDRSNMLDLESDFNVKVIEIKEDTYHINQDRHMTDTGLKHFHFIGHARLFLLQEILNEGRNVLYLDNDTGIVEGGGVVIKQNLDSILEWHIYSYECYKLGPWLEASYKMSHQQYPDDVREKYEALFPNKLDKMVYNAGALYLPCNNSSKYFIQTTIDKYRWICKELGHNMGHDQTALALAIIDENKHNTFVEHPVLGLIVHYYREKHNSQGKYIERILKEKELLNLSWNFQKKNLNKLSPIHVNNRGVFSVVNIEIDSNLEISSDDYWFYPHLDTQTDNVCRYQIGDHCVSSNGISLSFMSYENVYRRYSDYRHGFYLKNDHKKPIIPKKIHQVWLGPHPQPSNQKFNWDHKIWRDADITPELLGDCWDSYRKEQDFRLKAKIAAIAIIYSQGGIYLDMDYFLLRDLTDDFRQHEVFFAYENEYLFGAQICHYVFGGIIGSPVLKEMLKQLSKSIYKVVPLNTMITQFSNIFVYPSYVFYPEHYYGYRHHETLIKYSYGHHVWMTETGKIKYDLSWIKTVMNCESEEKALYACRILQSQGIDDIEFFEKCHDLFPDNVEIAYILGGSYRASKKWVKAYQILSNIDTSNLSDQLELVIIDKRTIVPSRIYQFDIYDELSQVCYYLNKKEQGLAALNKMYNLCYPSSSWLLYIQQEGRILQNKEYLLNLP
jgi:hypothetical protein